MATPKATKATKATDAKSTAPAAPAAASTPAPKSDKAAREMTAKGDVFKYVKDADKGAPQLKAIVNILKAVGPDGLKRSELTEKMVGVVVTRQPQGRILSYYQSKMVDSGYITVTTAAPVAKVPVTSAPPTAAPASN